MSLDVSRDQIHTTKGQVLSIRILYISVSLKEENSEFDLILKTIPKRIYYLLELHKYKDPMSYHSL